MNKKIVTFSFDDGVEFDERLVELLNRYNLKCTFNINTGLIPNVLHSNRADGLTVHYLSFEKMKEIYKGHEIASHAFKHKHLENCTKEEICGEIETDVTNLKKLFGLKEVTGFVYPYGTFNETVVDEVKKHGFKWARAVRSTFSFDPQYENRFAYRPTAHFLDEGLLELIDEFVKLDAKTTQILYIWGHSYEMQAYNKWDLLEEIFKRIANKEDIDYLTNSEAFKR